MRPKLSVAMATYNGEKYIREQLTSIANQLMLPDEVVICDDASSDSTVNIIEEFMIISPFPVKLHVNVTNIGYAKNFEQAVVLTSGDVIFLCDQDDIWLKDKIYCMNKALREEPGLLIVAHDCRFYSEDGSVSSTTLLKNMRRLRGGVNNQIHGCCTVIRRDLLEIALPLPSLACGNYSHDDWFHFVGSVLSRRKIVESVHLYYRRHEFNVTQSAAYACSAPHYLMTYHYFLSKLHNFKTSPVAHVRMLEERSIAISLLLSRIISLRTGIESERYDFYRKQLEKIYNGLQLRIKISSYKRLRRFLVASHMFLAGAYEPFSGWKSFLVDVIK